jgi:hypothetical protein
VTEVPPLKDAVNDGLQHKQAGADASQKLAADADTGFSVTGAIVSGMSHAVSFLEGALDYLPGLHLTDTAAAAPAKVESKPPTTANANAAKTTPETATVKTTPETPALTVATVATAVKQTTDTPAANAADIDKHFASVEHSDKSFTLTDFLKSTGYDTGTACTVAPAPNDVSIGNGSFTITNKAADAVNNGKVNTEGETLMTKSEWADVFDSINSQTGKDDLKLSKWQNDMVTGAAAGDTTKVSDGTIEKTADGFIHHDAKGKVDFERRGDLDIKHNADGTTSELNVKTGEKTLKDAQGHPEFVLGKDGFKGTTPDGTEVVISKDRKSATFTKFGITTTSLIADGQFTTTLNGLPIVGRSETALNSIPAAFQIVDHLLAGKSGMVTFADSKLIKGKDGLSMFVGQDGTSAVSLDAHSTVVRSPKGAISIFYNDSRPTVHLSDQQVTAMLAKHTQEVTVLAGVMQRLRDYAASGSLRNASGAVIKKSASGVSAESTDVVATGQGTQTVYTDKKTQISQLVNLKAQTVTLLNAQGEQQGTLNFSGKTTGFKTAAWDYKGGTVTTTDGSVYSPEGIKFADGTNFANNGNVTDKSGATYNNIGEIIAFEKPAYSSGEGSTKDTDDTKARAQVSQAESMASSMLGKVSGGHATAGDIAALLSSFEQLTSLVSSLSQFPDASLMASAVIAQGEVAGSIETAYATLNRNGDADTQATQASRYTDSPSATAAAAGSRTLAMAGSNV